MNIQIFYPSNPIQTSKVDEHYEEEYSICKSSGLAVHLIDIENITNSKIYPGIYDDRARIIYRGWMLNETSYTQLENRFGHRLVTSKVDYFNAHYLPNWYQEVKSLTIPSFITDEENSLEVFKQFSGKAFCKDFVKSLKTGKGSIVDSSEDLMRALSDMKQYRGFIEGGIVLRDVVDLIPNSETRFFVINNSIFSPIKNLHSYQLVEQVVKHLEQKKLKFYSVDVATTKEGKNILIEIGDGQVSDYVGWAVQDFVAILSNFENS